MYVCHFSLNGFGSLPSQGTYALFWAVAISIDFLLWYDGEDFVWLIVWWMVFARCDRTWIVELEVLIWGRGVCGWEYVGGMKREERRSRGEADIEFSRLKLIALRPPPPLSIVSRWGYSEWWIRRGSETFIFTRQCDPKMPRGASIGRQTRARQF